MNRILPLFLAAASVVAAHPSAAQPVAPAVRPDAATPGAVGDAPFPLTHDQVSDLQQKLNATGFSSGHVDGLWGLITATALMNFQRRHGLAPSGHLTPETVQALGAAVPAAGEPPTGTAAVQPNGAQQTPGAVVTAVPPPGSSATAGTDAVPPAAPATTIQSDGSGSFTSPRSSAAVPSLQASPADKAQPVSGANSFTPGEARRRIERNGFSQVSNLHKDGDGVWRGQATRAGQQVGVWLDYKGNIGQF